MADSNRKNSAQCRLSARIAQNDVCHTIPFQASDPDNVTDPSFHTIKYIVSDIDNAQLQKSVAVALITEDTTGEIYETDSVTVVCHYQPLLYPRVRWAYLENRTWKTFDPSQSGLTVTVANGTLSASKTLTFPKIRPSHVGTYACLAKYAPDMGSGYEIRRFKISINDTVPLSLGNATSAQMQIITLGYPPVEIFCDAQGAPKPQVTWLKDNVPLVVDNSSSDRNIDLFNESRLVIIRRPRAEDGGVYTCIAENRFDIIHADFHIRISSVLVQSIFSYWIIGLLAIALVLLTFVIVFLLVCLYLSKRKKVSLSYSSTIFLALTHAEPLSGISSRHANEPPTPTI